MSRNALVLVCVSCTLAACDPAALGTSGDMAVDCSFSFNSVTTTQRATASDGIVLPFGDLRLNATLFDDEFEGRSFSVSAHTEDGTVGNTVLYQFQSDEHPRNEFAGQHGFTGLNWVRDPGSGENLQYACFARRPGQPVSGWEE